jgi:hypothetical protein
MGRYSSGTRLSAGSVFAACKKHRSTAVAAGVPPREQAEPRPAASPADLASRTTY